MASKQTREQVQSMYIAYYGRPGDPDGVAWWVAKLEATSNGLDEILPAFGTSTEYEARMSGLGTDALIQRFYQQIFNRSVDEEGLAHWRTALDSGGMELADIAKRIWDGARGEDLSTLANKLAVAEAFSARVAASGQTYGATEIDAAVALLASVDSSATSLTAALKAVTQWGASGEDAGGSELAAQAAALSVVNEGLGETASPALLTVRALDSGDHWSGSTVSYSFLQQMPVSYANQTSTSLGWRPLSAVEISYARDSLARLNALIGIELVETSGSDGQIRFSAVTMSGMSGYAYFPGRSELAGDVFLEASGLRQGYFDTRGSYGPSVISHELGHALGLIHPFEGRVRLPVEADNTSHTLMSYVHDRQYQLDFQWAGNTVSADFVEVYPHDFALYDVQALQAIYGVNAATARGDDVYQLDVLRGERLTLWDGGGHDLLDLGALEGNSSIDLRGGTLSSAGEMDVAMLVEQAMAALRAQGASRAQRVEEYVRETVELHYPLLYNGENNLAIVQGVMVEDLITGSGNDVVWDNEVDNRILTGAGDDVVYLGSGGFDLVDGGTGFDVVVVTDARAAVEHGIDDDGSVLLVGSGWAARLVNVERVEFSDGWWEMG